MKTTVTKQKEINNSWHLIDASDKPLGRVCTEVSSLLIGKNKVNYTPNLVVGDKVVVINADKLVLTGNKLNAKKYYRHSGYADGFKERDVKYYLAKDSTFIIFNAVKGMLPKNKLRDQMLKNLRVYKDANHPHEGQVK